MKKITTSIAFAVGTMLAAQSSLAAGDPVQTLSNHRSSSASAAKQHGTAVNFVQTSAEANFKTISAGHYLLTLNQVNPHTYWFTDRPQRNAGAISTQKFVNLWDKGSHSFAQDNPNASLIGYTETGKKGDVVVEILRLEQPAYVTAKHQLAYHAHLLLTNNAQVKAEQLYNTSLFIDDDNPFCNSFTPFWC